MDSKFDDLVQAYGEMLTEAKKSKCAAGGAKGFKGGKGSAKPGKKIAQPKVTKFASKMKDLPGKKKLKEGVEDEEMVDPELEAGGLEGEPQDAGKASGTDVEARIAELQAQIDALKAEIEAMDGGSDIEVEDDMGDLEDEPSVEDED